MPPASAWPPDRGQDRERGALAGAPLDSRSESLEEREHIRGGDPRQLAAIVVARRFGFALCRARLVAELAGLAVAA